MTATIGPGVDRVDAPLKVRGAAPYPSDVTYPDLAHAALVRSTVATGRVVAINDADARARPPGCWPLSRTRLPRSWQGRVRGVDNLRVADASILPDVPSIAPLLTIIMTAERMSDWITVGTGVLDSQIAYQTA